MKKELPEKARIRKGAFSTPPQMRTGYFLFPHPKQPARFKFKDICLFCYASDENGWSRVSFTYFRRNSFMHVNIEPTATDVAFVMRQFFEADETVAQYHTPADLYQQRPYWITLWQPLHHKFFVPHPLLLPQDAYVVGPEGKTYLDEARADVEQQLEANKLEDAAIRAENSEAPLPKRRLRINSTLTVRAYRAGQLPPEVYGGIETTIPQEPGTIGFPDEVTAEQ